MLFADSEGHWFLILFAVLGFLGEGVVRLTNRMLALRLTIRAWATGLEIDANHYILGGGVAVPFRWEGVPATIAEWQSAGNDAAGVFELSS